MDELDSYEVIYHEKDLVASLKEQLRVARQAHGLTKVKIENPSTGISTLTKPQLLERCMEVGLEVPSTATKGTLCTMLREHFMILEPLQWGEKLGFSKHRNLTMGEVKTHQPGFIQWAKDEVTESSHWGLKRFVKWIDHLEPPAVHRMAAPVPGDTPGSSSKGPDFKESFGGPPMAKVQAKAAVRRKAEPEEPTMTVDAQERIPTIPQGDQILMALNALAQKMTNIENQTAANTQRIAAMQATEPWDEHLEEDTSGFRTGSETRNHFG